ncbi:MAG: SPOR domain-containing protein [[Clostridium] fimetarium]|nr:SPOR domain-containing protein [Alistipes timonensis]MCM1406554.1 SPOR domain-containing protein [[Clostridium] fimetarium]
MAYRSLLILLTACSLPLAPSAQELTATEPAAETPAPEGEAGIVARVNDPASAVSFEMPPALLERVSGAAETSGDESRESATEADDEAERHTKVRGAKSVGYRVQVYSDNNARTAKGTARQRERVISGAFPQYGTYVTYASPYWRLRVGDFRSQYDAEKAAAEIKRAFPSFGREVRVVRDRVNLR